MPHTSHELSEAFPDAEDRIRRLKAADPRFVELTDRYDDVNRLVLRIENGEEVSDDFFLEDQKKRRLKLLDAIAARLRAPAAGLA
jgi:uncharacterized protein YdcH (DUF465 family)